MRTGVGVSDRTIARDADFARVRRRITASFPPSIAALSVSPALYGLEVLKPGGWRPVVGFFSRRMQTYSSKSQAIDACIQHWTRFGLPVRPFRLD